MDDKFRVELNQQGYHRYEFGSFIPSLPKIRKRIKKKKRKNTLHQLDSKSAIFLPEINVSKLKDKRSLRQSNSLKVVNGGQVCGKDTGKKFDLSLSGECDENSKCWLTWLEDGSEVAQNNSPWSGKSRMDYKVRKPQLNQGNLTSMKCTSLSVNDGLMDTIFASGNGYP